MTINSSNFSKSFAKKTCKNNKSNHNSICENLLKKGIEILLQLETTQKTFDDLLDDIKDKVERKRVSHLLFSYLRNKNFIDSEIARLCTKALPKKKIAKLLALAMTQSKFQQGIAPEAAINVAVEIAKKDRADKFVNGVLRNFLKSNTQPFTEAKDIFPEVLYKRWKKHYPDNLPQIAQAYLTESPFTFRIEKDYTIDFIDEVKPIASFGNYRFFTTNEPGKILESKEFADGKIYIQDPATSLAPSLANYDNVKSVIDLCAAPGGKSLLMAEKLNPNATLLAIDKSEKRQKFTLENFQKRNLPYEVKTALPKDIKGSFDLVLADVPCSNTGVCCKRPDSILRFSAKDLASITKIQKQILEEAARLTNSNGQLIYSTCSIEPEENILMVEEFVKNHQEFSLIKYEQLLPTLEHDGAFAALLIKK